MSEPTPLHLNTPIVCNIWRNTLFKITVDGIEVKCKSCRGAIHIISRERLEQEWIELKRLQAMRMEQENPAS